MEKTTPGSATVHIAVAGWNIPPQHRELFPKPGSHLERYARLFSAVEINSSFYRPHRPATYERWAASVPDHFRFAAKVPRAITHTKRLKNATAELERFLAEVTHLGEKLGPLLVQLPPSLKFDAKSADAFFAGFRERHSGVIVCEPRHPTWFTPAAEEMLVRHEVPRVAADPAVVEAAAEPGGASSLVYYRLHGSPKMYYSDYAEEYLQGVAARLRAAGERGQPAWCVFDNTAEGAATANALRLQQLLGT